MAEIGLSPIMFFNREVRNIDDTEDLGNILEAFYMQVRIIASIVIIIIVIINSRQKTC